MKKGERDFIICILLSTLKHTIRHTHTPTLFQLILMLLLQLLARSFNFNSEAEAKAKRPDFYPQSLSLSICELVCVCTSWIPSNPTSPPEPIFILHGELILSLSSRFVDAAALSGSPLGSCWLRVVNRVTWSIFLTGKSFG